MNDYFDRAFSYTIGNEGSFSNDAADSGGATRWGITRHDASRWYNRPVSVDEMRTFPIETAKEIYSAWYWRPLSCDKILVSGVAVAMFDIGLVRGIGVPPNYAQQICNKYGAKLAEDGHIGPLTLKAINLINPDVFIEEFSLKARNGFLAIVARNPTQVVFIKGWLARAKRLLTLK